MLFFFQFLLGQLPRGTEDNAYAKFWSDKQRALWYVLVFSGVVNYLQKRGGRQQTEKLCRKIPAHSVLEP